MAKTHVENLPIYVELGAIMKCPCAGVNPRCNYLLSLKKSEMIAPHSLSWMPP
jgi:hypothetical protein